MICDVAVEMLTDPRWSTITANSCWTPQICQGCQVITYHDVQFWYSRQCALIHILHDRWHHCTDLFPPRRMAFVTNKPVTTHVLLCELMQSPVGHKLILLHFIYHQQFIFDCNHVLLFTRKTAMVLLIYWIGANPSMHIDSNQTATWQLSTWINYLKYNTRLSLVPRSQVKNSQVECYSDVTVELI